MSQGLISTTGAWAKSLTLRVTTAKPCSSAVAAISESNAAMGLPAASAWAHRRAQYPAVSRVKGKARCPNPACTLASQVVNSLRRREAGRRTIPRSSSASVRAETYKSEDERSPIQPSTAGWGAGRTNSDSKHVSRRYFTDPHPRSSGRIGSGERSVSSGSPRGACRSSETSASSPASRRYSGAASSTTASLPLRVTNCGPSLKAHSTNSLKRLLAS